MTDTATSPRSAQWSERYVSLLGVERRPPSLAALSELVRAHVLRVPFENVTSLQRRERCPTGAVPQPDPDALLTAWEHRSGGGLCFEICDMLVRLLTTLGYQAHIVLGQISLPNGHQAIIVTLENARYLLDLGNGAPLFEPIALQQLPVEIHRHGLSYRFSQDQGQRDGQNDGQNVGKRGDQQHLIQQRLIDGEWATHCHYDLRPAQAVDRNSGYQHHHIPNASWVTATLTMVRSTPDAVFALRDNTLSRFSVDGKTTQDITRTAQYIDVARTVFDLPALPIAAALRTRAKFEASKE